MKCNYKNSLREKIITENKKKLVKHMDSNLTLWEIITISTLHFAFGFGKKRLQQFMEEYLNIASWFNDYVRVTDSEMVLKKGNVCTNYDAGILKMINDLRRDGIEYTEILGDDVELCYVDKNGDLIDLKELDRKIQEGEGRLNGCG